MISYPIGIAGFLVQLGIPCYFGTLVVVSYERFRRKIAQCNWVDAIIHKGRIGKSFRQILVFVMLFSNRENSIILIKLFPLNLQSFLNVS